MAASNVSTPRVFKSAWFAKAARKAGIADRELCDAMKAVMAGKADDLGGGVWKKRLDKNRHRSIVLAKGGHYWVYAYLFAKNDRENITDDELVEFRRLAKSYAAVQDRALADLLKQGDLRRSAMSTKRKHKSDAFEAIHSSASALYRVGTIDKATMRSFDESCLVAPTPLKPEQIKHLRENLKVSQPVFARYLNTSESTVEKWESGAKRPSGMALKLLAIAKKHGLEVLV